MADETNQPEETECCVGPTTSGRIYMSLSRGKQTTSIIVDRDEAERIKQLVSDAIRQSEQIQIEGRRKS